MPSETTSLHATPNLSDYDHARASFSWDTARRELDGLPNGRGLNIAYEAVSRHVEHGHGAQTAIVWLGKKGERHELSYAELDARSGMLVDASRDSRSGSEDPAWRQRAS